ncbi:DUF4272 domain-containing protein [Mucilaginibacter sp.]|uniref:DUF4272 domain-containing protein n=1 Tax=Mucilaginibacter sp. TaxID=1882438 RepID=UPI00260F7B9E|nr:DUF4272 domain-containing protein [Mucilaginibacter sp.]MDB4923510.1 hypothetical protein [Mucilaginibacter sp.]
MSAEIKTECPKCEWEPDGYAHWGCTCGHSWNTFDTKAKCPACGIQWQDTHCPGCGQSSKHELWYTSQDKQQEPVAIDHPWLRKRKQIIENKLVAYGIKNSRISYLPYLEFSEEDFQTPYEVGCRILILWAVSYVAGNLHEKDIVESWLKTTVLWDKVSEHEKKLFEGEISQRTLIDFSWRVEAGIVLSWVVNLIEDLPGLDSQMSDDDLDELMAKLPINENPDFFLSTLVFRDKEEIFIENITNEMITSYLRNLMLSDKKEPLSINPTISFERHYALNWVRKFDEISEWDETDTST